MPATEISTIQLSKVRLNNQPALSDVMRFLEKYTRGYAPIDTTLDGWSNDSRTLVIAIPYGISYYPLASALKADEFLVKQVKIDKTEYLMLRFWWD